MNAKIKVCYVVWIHVVVGDDVDIDAAVSLEPNGDHHDKEVKNWVLALADNLPVGLIQSRAYKTKFKMMILIMFLRKQW